MSYMYFLSSSLEIQSIFALNNNYTSSKEKKKSEKNNWFKGVLRWKENLVVVLSLWYCIWILHFLIFIYVFSEKNTNICSYEEKFFKIALISLSCNNIILDFFLCSWNYRSLLSLPIKNILDLAGMEVTFSAAAYTALHL